MTIFNCNKKIGGVKDPLYSWFFYTSTMLIVFGFTLFKSLVTGLRADTSHISIVILIIFSFSLFYSFKQALLLQKEWEGIGRLIGNSQDSNYKSDSENLVEKILNHSNPTNLKVMDLVDSYFSTHEVPLRILSVTSGVMVTLGLVGTILGLIVSVSGLENIMSNIGGGGNGMLGGIKQTISGMAIAFYTTLFGAILGAIVLKMISLSLINSLTMMSSNLFNYIEFKVNTLTELQTNPNTNSLLNTVDLFVNLSNAIQNTESELKNFTGTMLNSRLQEISFQLESCVHILKNFQK